MGPVVLDSPDTSIRITQYSSDAMVVFDNDGLVRVQVVSSDVIRTRDN